MAAASQKPFPPRSRCVFTSAGDRNAVAGWLPPGGERGFDLCVAFYGQDDARFAEISRLADRAWRIKGGKAQNLRALVQAGELDLSPYSHVWLPDDDLLLDPQDVPRLFYLAEHFGFWVSQPAFERSGRVSYPHTAVARERAQVRLVSFVETTCPLFRRDKLEEFLGVFDGSLSGWGLDLWFGHVLGAEVPGRFGVIDAVTVFNPHERQKPGGFREISALRSDAARIREYQIAAARHGILRRPVSVFGAKPLPEGLADGHTPPRPRPRFPRPTDLTLTDAEQEVLTAALTPPPRVAMQWGVDGITASILRAGAELVVATEDNVPWANSCRRDPALAAAHASRRLIFAAAGARPPPPAAAAPRSAPPLFAGDSAWEVLADRGAWPDLLVVPPAALACALGELGRASPGATRPPPRVLVASPPGAAAGAPPEAAAWRTAKAAGGLRLLAPADPPADTPRRRSEAVRRRCCAT